jgi:hypothetical protein
MSVPTTFRNSASARVDVNLLHRYPNNLLRVLSHEVPIFSKQSNRSAILLAIVLQIVLKILSQHSFKSLQALETVLR